MTRKALGESVTLKLVRGSATIEVDVVLKPEIGWISNQADGLNYVIIGGLVAVPLSTKLEDEIYRKRLYSTYGTLHDLRALDYKDMGQQALIITTVLAHPINIDLERFEGKRIKAINGKAVTNLSDLAASFDGAMASAEFLEIGFYETDAKAVLETSLVKEAQPQILEQHLIPADRNSGM